jgi:hypothetical protein
MSEVLSFVQAFQERKKKQEVEQMRKNALKFAKTFLPKMNVSKLEKPDDNGSKKSK